MVRRYILKFLAKHRQVNDETKKHWSFQPVKKPAVPEVKGDWAKSEIDAFILSQLQKNGLEPNPSAEPRELVRRVYYDLTGLPPEPEVVEAFAKDPSPEAWSN